MTHVLQLIRLVPTVVVAITDKVLGHTPAILAGELVLLAGLVGAALLVTAVAAVVTPIAPDFRRKAIKDELTLSVRVTRNVLRECSGLTCRSCVCKGHCYR